MRKKVAKAAALLPDDLTSELDIAARLDAFQTAAANGRATNIGFPGASDIDYSPVLPSFRALINNVGDPWTDPGGTAHSKVFEREVLDWFADLFGAAPEDRWGYLTSGGTEGNLYGLFLARTRWPEAMVYYSAASHYSIPKVIDLLGMPSIAVRAGSDGEMDYSDLATVLGQHRHRPAVVVATAGTTMTEAVDDVLGIKQTLQEMAIRAHHIHVDAALAGVPLALAPTRHPRGSLTSTIDSIAISGHKFFGTPIPCGVVLTRRSLQQRIGEHVAYTATLDTTINGSRCGQVALLLWYAIRRYGVAGLRARTLAARELAERATQLLQRSGWDAWRHPHAFTVVFRTPPQRILDKWVLANSAGWSHLICMPGIEWQQIEAFVADLVVAQAPDRSLPAGEEKSVAVPVQRKPRVAAVN